MNYLQSTVSDDITIPTVESIINPYPANVENMVSF